jgi:kumamolisin
VEQSPLATGGGVSGFFDLPAYQLGAGVPTLPTPSGFFVGRGLPDVAGHADSYLEFFNGQLVAVNGTSCVAPLWAGLIVLMNQLTGIRVGFLNPLIYGRFSGAGALNDIVSGNNGAYRAGLDGIPARAAAAQMGY